VVFAGEELLIFLNLFSASSAHFRRLMIQKGARFERRLVDQIGEPCADAESGARNIDKILTNTMLPDLSREILGALVDGRRVNGIRVKVRRNSQFTCDTTLYNRYGKKRLISDAYEDHRAL
jgi:hypothetical protein